MSIALTKINATALLIVFMTGSVLFSQVPSGQPTDSGEVGKKAAATLSPQARAAAEQGLEFLKQKRFKDAANAFLAAARQHPTNGQLRHLLGVSYAQDKQLGQAWLQFRQAVRLNPGYEPATRDFLTLWESFDRSGVLNVGRTSEQIEKAIGKPDAKQEAENRLTWVYGFMRVNFLTGRLFSLVDPRGVNREALTPVDFMKLDFDDQQWLLGYQAVNRLQTVSEYTPPGQTVQKWDEMFTVQRLHGMTVRKVTPREMMNQIRDELAKMDVEFEVMQDNGSDVLFHWRDKGNKQRPAQHEIVRLVAGKKDIHRLAYARKVARLPTTEAQKWIDLLQLAVLTPAAPAAAK